MNAGMLGSLFTVVVFGAFGWATTRLSTRTLGARALVVLSLLLVVAAIVAGFIGDGIWLFGVDDFGVPLNYAIIAFCLGGCAGLLIRARDRRRGAKA